MAGRGQVNLPTWVPATSRSPGGSVLPLSSVGVLGRCRWTPVGPADGRTTVEQARRTRRAGRKDGAISPPAVVGTTTIASNYPAGAASTRGAPREGPQ